MPSALHWRGAQGSGCTPESARLLHVRDEVPALALLLHAGEDHLRPRDVLLRVDQVLEHVLVAPDDAAVLVRVAVAEARGLAARAAKDAVQVRALLHRAAVLDGVALRTLGLEELEALLDVARGDVAIRLRARHGGANRHSLE